MNKMLSSILAVAAASTVASLAQLSPANGDFANNQSKGLWLNRFDVSHRDSSSVATVTDISDKPIGAQGA